VARSQWDWVILAVPSPSLPQPWFQEMKRAIGQAPLIALQLGMNDAEWLEGQVGKDRVFYGMINLISYAVPLTGHEVPAPGTAYWFPPFSAMPFSGPDREKLQRLVDLYLKGGMRAGIVQDTGATVRFPDFLLTALVTALELVGWKFKDLNRTPDVRLAIEAAEEQNAILDKKLGTRRPFYFSILRPAFMRLVLWLGERVLPLPLEPYIEVHFKKVNEQFQRGRKEMISEGRKYGLSTRAIEELDRRLASLRSGPVS
jgi:2-dehydropantoate 2-reductase